jgi:hypothetical protein
MNAVQVVATALQTVELVKTVKGMFGDAWEGMRKKTHDLIKLNMKGRQSEFESMKELCEDCSEMERSILIAAYFDSRRKGR